MLITIYNFYKNIGFISDKRDKFKEVVEAETLRRENHKGSLTKDYIPFISQYIRGNIDRYERVDKNLEKILSEIQIASIQEDFLNIVEDNHYYASIESCKKNW